MSANHNAPSAATPAAPAAPRAGLPPQIPFIIGNEACERFSFYGMRNILTQFLVGSLLVEVVATEREAAAKEVFHVFVMAVYFFPLLGGWLADRLLGKYRTILYLSFVYSAGNLCLALFTEQKWGFYAGLALIGLGSGGIKPCVSAFVGEQFDQRTKHLSKLVFDAFYWIINFGSFFASLLIPLALQSYGPRVAFGIPGVLMLVATLVFWLGRKRYVVEPPATADPHSFARVVRTALLARVEGSSRPGLTVFVAGCLLALGSVALAPWLGVVAALCLALVIFIAAVGIGASWQIDRARAVHPDTDVDGARSVLSLLIVFALVTPFWSLFDQKASTWILQARAMALPGWGWFTSPSQMQALNPLLVMLLIPFNNVVLYPLLRRLGIEPTPLRRMTTGILLAALAWVAIGLLQQRLDAGNQLPILWQVLPYALLTLGEVLVSATGLEFAYSQAPLKMKSVLMSFWSLAVTVGSLWVLLANALVRNDVVIGAIKGTTGLGTTAFQMYFFAAFAALAALCFALYARRYHMQDNYRAG